MGYSLLKRIRIKFYNNKVNRDVLDCTSFFFAQVILHILRIFLYELFHVLNFIFMFFKYFREMVCQMIQTYCVLIQCVEMKF